MSDKRFICGLGFPINSDDPIRIISDSVENKDYYKFSDICNVLNKQQDTIFKLQDLCGKSDEENAKLRIENKRLQDEIDELKKDIDIYEYEEKKHSETVRKLYEENEQLIKEIKSKNKIIELYYEMVGLNE